MKVFTWALAVLLLMIPSRLLAAAAAELQTATLTGTVADPAGASISSAEVAVFRGSTEIAHVHTDGKGLFTFSGAPGQYVVSVSAPGFAPIRHAQIPFDGYGASRFTLNISGTGGGLSTPTPEPLPLESHASNGRLSEPPVKREANLAPWDVGALFQGGVGVTENRGSFRFLLGGAHLGKVLTGEIGTGLLRGNFEYAGELFPYWQSFTPRFERNNCSSPITGELVCSPFYTTGGTYTGVSLTPIILRWNFTHGQRLMPWVQGAGGLLWTNHKYPAFGSPVSSLATNGPGTDTSVWNFTPQFGVGTHLFVKPKRSIDFSANAVHISSASLGDKNPGVNASMQFAVGYSWWTR